MSELFIVWVEVSLWDKVIYQEGYRDHKDYYRGEDLIDTYKDMFVMTAIRTGKFMTLDSYVDTFNHDCGSLGPSDQEDFIKIVPAALVNFMMRLLALEKDPSSIDLTSMVQNVDTVLNSYTEPQSSKVNL